MEPAQFHPDLTAMKLSAVVQLPRCRREYLGWRDHPVDSIILFHSTTSPLHPTNRPRKHHVSPSTIPSMRTRCEHIMHIYPPICEPQTVHSFLFSMINHWHGVCNKYKSNKHDKTITIQKKEISNGKNHINIKITYVPQRRSLRRQPGGRSTHGPPLW